VSTGPGLLARELREVTNEEASVLRGTGPVGTEPQQPWPEPEDRGTATLSELGHIEYVADLVRPGRIVVWAAEEGSGKSYAVGGELAIRIAVAGGRFAETWEILESGAVLYLSEMHSDDDFEREEIVLASLDLDRTDVTGRYYRLPLMTAAHGRPALTVAGWRAWISDWMRSRGVLIAIFDTATGATLVDPWGKEMQQVFANPRLMLAEYPALAIILLLHLKKPSGRGDRRISDVLGESGRWSDVVVLMENDGKSLTRTKVSVRKRVRNERRIVATKSGGLLVDAPSADAGKGPKVELPKVLEAIAAEPGMTYAELGKKLTVSKDTAANYVKDLGDAVHGVPFGGRGTLRLYLADATDSSTTAEPPKGAE
jgi:hypothetical protein